MRLRYTPEALQDLQSMSDYISKVLYNPVAATRITRGILSACAHLKAHPHLGVSIQEKLGYESNLRYLVCEKHLAIYKIEDDCISVARILSGRQDYLHILFGDDVK